ncbi:MAG: YdcF family protein [Pseudomonadota bacterium]|nr:YdcF family protein [Pseudomonadota bacterium]
MEKGIIALISPLGTVLLAALLCGWAWWLGRRPVAACLALFAVSWLWLWSLPPVAGHLAASIEADHAPMPLAAIPHADAIVVLGGAYSDSGLDPDSGQEVEFGEAAERLWFAIRLFRAGKAPRILLSGGHDPDQGKFSEADAMAGVAADFAIAEGALLREGASRNTRENARFSANLLRREGIDTIILVTSASHMRRALVHFSAEGLAVIPAPTDYQAPRLARKPCCLPDAEALAVSGQMFKELLGQWIWP